MWYNEREKGKSIPINGLVSSANYIYASAIPFSRPLSSPLGAAAQRRNSEHVRPRQYAYPTSHHFTTIRSALMAETIGRINRRSKPGRSHVFILMEVRDIRKLDS